MGMDTAVINAMLKWPDVPACWGWLALDERGRWRLGQSVDGRHGEPVRHRGLADYLGRNYAATPDGAWFVQNGPQRVWVDLDAAPMVLDADADGAVVTHTGLRVARIDGALIDESGRLFVTCEHGLALVGSALATQWLDHLLCADGRPADADALATSETLRLALPDGPLTVERTLAADLPERFGFVPAPRPATTAETVP